MAAATKTLVERERELATIAAALKRLVAERRGGAIWLQGPPGIGKTALVRESERLARENGAEALVATGAETETGFPFEIARQALAPLALSQDRTFERALSAPGGKLAAPIVRPDPAATTPEPVHAALHGLTTLFATVARERPLALLVDDLHWADPDSLRFLAYLARRCDRLGLLLVAASLEPEHWPQTQAPAAETRDLENSCECLCLDVLSVKGVEKVLRAAFEETPPAGFAAALHGRSGGNPLFVRELIASLEKAGVRPGARAVRYLEEACPASVARLIDRRLALLSTTARGICEAAASLPGTPPLELVGEVARVPPQQVRAALDELQAAGLARADAAHLRFAYPLVRSVVLRSLGSARREQLHALAAKALRLRGAADAEVAARLLHVAPRSDPHALETLRRAGSAALERGAAARAAAFFERALAEVDDDSLRCELLLLLGRAELAAGRASSIEHLRSAARSPEAAIAVAAARALGRTLAMAGVRDPAAPLRETLGRFVQIDPELDLEARTEMAALARAYLSTVDEGRASIAELARRRPGTRTLVGRWALAVISCDRALAGESSRSVAALAERALACDARELIGELSLGYLATSALIFADRLDAAALALRRIADAALHAGAEMTELLATGLGAVVAYRRGFVAVAARGAREVRQRAIEGGWGARQWVPVEVIAASLLEANELDRAETLLTARLAEVDPDDGWAPAAARFELGRLALARGDARRAADELAAAGEHLEAWRAPSPAAIQWRPYLALAEAALARNRRANEVIAEDLARAEQAELPRCRGIGLRVAAHLDPDPLGASACRKLEEAAELLELAGAELELGVTELQLGSALAARGYSADARARLRSAAARARRCRSRRLLEATRARLAALGARLPPEAATAESLTERELRVARLAAAGRTNREIADELIVTVKTVEFHLTNAYRKLGIRQRHELAQALDRLASWLPRGDRESGVP